MLGTYLSLILFHRSIYLPRIVYTMVIQEHLDTVHICTKYIRLNSYLFHQHFYLHEIGQSDTKHKYRLVLFQLHLQNTVYI